MEQLTDFRNTYVSWLTQDQSHGRFSVDAVLETSDETYYLGSGVMACNMYAAQNLPIAPAYLFQIALSETHYHIFRSPAVTAPAEDSSGKVSDRFSSITISEQAAPVHILTAEEIKPALQNGIYLLARTNVGTATGSYALTFPVKHINYSDRLGRFQAETGPVLLPSANGLQLSYVAFNTLDRIDFVTRNAVENKAHTNTYTGFQSQPCTTHLYTYSV